MKIKQVFKKRFVRIFSVLVAIGVIGSFGFNAAMTALNSSAATRTFRSDGTLRSMAGFRVYYINDNAGGIAYCLNGDYGEPTGQSFNSIAASGAFNTPQFKGILYYGYGGPGQNELMSKHQINGDNARILTQIAIWKYGAGKGVPGNDFDPSPDVLDAGNAQMKGYVRDLMNKTYGGSGSTSLNLPVSLLTGNGGTRQTTSVVTLPSGMDRNNTNVTLSGDGGQAAVEWQSNSSFKVTVPLTYKGRVDIKVSGPPSGGDLTPLVWTTSAAGVQDVVSAGGQISTGGNTSGETFAVFNGTTTDTPPPVDITPPDNPPVDPPVNLTQNVYIKIQKKDSDGQPVDGVVFDVSTDPSFPQSPLNTKRVTTVSHRLIGEGTVTTFFGGYTKGEQVKLYIKEISAPDHLIVDPTVKTITVTAGDIEIKSIEIINKIKTQEATASIIKTDDQNNRLANAVFEISTDRNFATDVSELTTPNGGVVSKTFQLTGDTLKVYVREKTAPNGYVKSTEVKEMTLRAGQAESVTYVNTQKTLSSTAKIVKKDAAGNLVQGVQFEIATNAQFTGAETLTTNAQGEISKSFTATGTQTLPTVYVREKTVPAHLVLDTRVQSKQLVDGQTAIFEFTNQFKPVTLKLVKKDAAGNFVQGVVFEVSESQNFANPTTLTTGANGEISREFPTTTREKTFYVREKTVPAHLVLSTEVKNVRISAGQTGAVEYVNQFNQADLTIRKVDEKGKTVQGVVFEIADNAQFTNPQTVTTNAQGVATRRYPTTQASKTYYIREKSVPSHLVLSKEVKTLTLAPNTNPTVTFTNEFVEREVKLSKRDVSSADPIEGVTFTIYDAEDKDNKTKIYETITNKEGDLPGLKLKPGKYKFIETHAPIGYKINPNPHFFEVLEDGTILGSTIMTDEREEYEFEIDKVDNKGNKVRGVVFEAKNKLTGEILTATTDQDGVAKFKGIWADYEITEKSAPEGYEKDNNVYVLQLKIDGTYERMKVVNNKIEAPNTGAESANFLPILAGVASILLGGTAFFAKKRF